MEDKQLNEAIGRKILNGIKDIWNKVFNKSKRK